MKMKRFNEISANTDLYTRIKLSPMNQLDREVALNALRTSDAIVDGIQWVVNGVKHVIAKVSEKPVSLRHSHWAAHVAGWRS
jgi:hypothetical protein